VTLDRGCGWGLVGCDFFGMGQGRGPWGNAGMKPCKWERT